MKHQGKTKQIPKTLTSDVQIHCSLSFNMNQPPLTQQLVGMLITVDAFNVLRVYLQMPEQCELLFKVQIFWSDPEDFASCVEFFIRAKAIIISSKLKGETIAITSKLK
jgi:hypothetical protein